MKVFIELEMNKIAKVYKEIRKHCRNEIIEIVAVKVDDSNQIIDSYKTYVRPVYNDKISHVVQDLTGISMEMVQEALPLQEAMDQFVSWCGEDCTVYSWSDNDLNQIRTEFAAKELPVSDRLSRMMENWVNYQKEFEAMFHLEKSISLEKAVEIIDLDFSGQIHDAMFDTQNTAQIYIQSQESESFNRIQAMVQDLFSEHTFSMGNLFDFKDLKFT